MIFCQKSLGTKPDLLESVQQTNILQVKEIVKLVEKSLKTLKNKKITILGLSFKEESDDIRESTSIKLIKILLKKQMNIRVHDPKAIENTRKIFGDKILYFEKIKDALGGSVSGKRLAILGLTFKPETDDMRDAPSLSIIPSLIEQKAIVVAHDPVGIDEAKKVLPNEVEFSSSIEEATKEADALVIMTEWNQYRGLDLNKLKTDC